MELRCPEQALILGVMTGTSCDGVDLALLRFGRPKEGWELVCWSCQEFDDVLFSARLRAAQDQRTEALSSLHFEYARSVARAVLAFRQRYPEHTIDLVVLSGQTVCHKPGSLKRTRDSFNQALQGLLGEGSHTCQIGDGCALAKLTKLPVLWNLRAADVALGGQGAPLVPAADAFLFGSRLREQLTDLGICSSSDGSDGEVVCLLNIGGVANATLLSVEGTCIAAMDCGPD
mmetsp:Transcript_5441/g.19886  ORF Transcript_5441/g.19886 Transcript_5441/m.19886 type:complete len:231 (-) Transcript_5441:9-701(-)